MIKISDINHQPAKIEMSIEWDDKGAILKRSFVGSEAALIILFMVTMNRRPEVKVIIENALEYLKDPDIKRYINDLEK